MGKVAPIVMSAIVFAGSAQFAATAVLADGGGAAAAILAGMLLNARFLPMGIALAPSVRGGRLWRALVGQAIIDASWALANRGGGRFDVDYMLGATLVNYPAWVAGTAIGVFAGEVIGDPSDLGLDAIFPAFFLGLLANELRDSLEHRRGIDRRRGRARAHAAGSPGRAGAGRVRRSPARAEAPMSAVWVTIGGLAVTTAAIKAAGPLALGGRSLPTPVVLVISLLAPALLAALVITQTFADGKSLVLDARAAGVAAAAAAIALRAPLVVTIVVAAVVTACVSRCDLAPLAGRKAIPRDQVGKWSHEGVSEGRLRRPRRGRARRRRRGAGQGRGAGAGPGHPAQVPREHPRRAEARRPRAQPAREPRAATGSRGRPTRSRSRT